MKKHAAVKEQKTLDASVKVNIIGTALANSMELELNCTLRIYFDIVTLTLHNVMLTSQKPYQYNYKFGCSETNGYNIPQDVINEV